MIRSLLSIILTCISCIAFAQTRSTEKEVINSKTYYVHTVRIRETFYGLSKLYGVSIDDIQISNNNLKALSVGQKILIPATEENADIELYTDKDTTKDGRAYIIHFVQPGETIYALARNYQTTAGEIMSANQELYSNQSLSIRQKLLIPRESIQTTTIGGSTTQTTTQETQSETVVSKEAIRMTLLLPFFLNKQSVADGTVSQKNMIYEGSLQFIEYYEGALLALDSLKKLGISVNLEVIESNSDSASTNINKIKTTNDLIIGPVFQKTFPGAASFAKRHSIPIVYPLSSENVNTTNPYVIQINTPQYYRFRAMVDNIVSNNENCHVCIVYNSENEKKTLQQCKGAFTEFKEQLNAKRITTEELYYPTVGNQGIDKALAKKEKTIIVVLSKQQAFANNIVTKLFQSSKTHNIELWGLPQWERYENIELDFLYDLHFKLVSYGEINYKSPRVNSFITLYRDTYNSEPSKFSFQGFDQMLYFGKLLSTNKNILNNLENNEEPNGLIEIYSFAKKEAGAHINTSAYIIEYDKKTFTRKATLYVPSK
ncbi:MAG: LysM peptidoglycan-binding domain-containing protein [Bacteroidales bacterium]|nr:LysM peptidoglycan-binding domain-containing protein [Bacteroidales bacterium]